MKAFICTCAVLFGMVCSAWAEVFVGNGTGGVFIKKVEYKSLTAAVEAINTGEAQGDTIKLMRDVTEPTIEITASMTIDFNGFHYHITAENEDEPIAVQLPPAEVGEEQPELVDVTLKNGTIAIAGNKKLYTLLGVVGNVTLENMVLDGKYGVHSLAVLAEYPDAPYGVCTVMVGEVTLKGNTRILAPTGVNAISMVPLAASSAGSAYAPKLKAEGKNVLVGGALNVFLGSDNPATRNYFQMFSDVVIPATMELELSEATEDLGFAWAKVGSNKELAYTVTLPDELPAGVTLTSSELDSLHMGIPEGAKAKITGLPSGVKLVTIKGKDGNPDTYELQGSLKKAGPFTALMTVTGSIVEDVSGEEVSFSYVTQLIGNVTNAELTTAINDDHTAYYNHKFSGVTYDSPNKISVTKGPYTLGKTIKLSATPAAGYEFEGWSLWQNEGTGLALYKSFDDSKTSFVWEGSFPRELHLQAEFTLRAEIEDALLAGEYADWGKTWVLTPGEQVEIPVNADIASRLTVKGLPSGLKFGKDKESGTYFISGTPKKVNTASTVVFTLKSEEKGEPAQVTGRLLIVNPYEKVTATCKQNGKELEEFYYDYIATAPCGVEIDPITMTFNLTPKKVAVSELPKGLKFKYDAKSGEATITGAMSAIGLFYTHFTITGPGGDLSNTYIYFRSTHQHGFKIPELDAFASTGMEYHDSVALYMTPQKGEWDASQTFEKLNAWLATEPTAKISGLPSGMKVTKDKATGTLSITGTPKAGGYSLLTITIEGENGEILTRTLTFNANNKLEIELAKQEYFHVAYGEKAMVHPFEYRVDEAIPTAGILNTNLGITFPDESQFGYFAEDDGDTPEGTPIDLADYTVTATGLPKGMKLEKKVYTLTHTDTPKEKITTYVITGTPKVSDDDEWDETDEEAFSWRYAEYGVTLTFKHKATGAIGSTWMEFSLEDYLQEYYKGTFIAEGYPYFRYLEDTPGTRAEDCVMRVVVDRPTGFGGTATVYLCLPNDEYWQHSWVKIMTLPFAYNDAAFMDEGATCYTAWYAKGKNRIAFFHDFTAPLMSGYLEPTAVVIDNIEYEDIIFSTKTTESGIPVWDEYAFFLPAGAVW